MAIWQYTFGMLPKIENRFITSINDETCEESWKLRHIDKTVFESFSNTLPETKSWSNHITLYGSDESNCVEAYAEGNRITEASVRIDFRSNYLIFLRELIKFSNLHSFTLFDESRNLVNLSESELNNCIIRSKQYLIYETIFKP